MSHVELSSEKHPRIINYLCTHAVRVVTIQHSLQKGAQTISAHHNFCLFVRSNFGCSLFIILSCRNLVAAVVIVVCSSVICDTQCRLCSCFELISHSACFYLSISLTTSVLSLPLDSFSPVIPLRWSTFCLIHARIYAYAVFCFQCTWNMSFISFVL